MYLHVHVHVNSHNFTFTLCVCNFTFTLCMYACGCAGSGVWTSMNVDKNIVYFPYTDLNPALEGFIRFWTYIIIYQVHVHVLCCFALFVCLTLLASFFLPSHLSFKNMYMCMDMYAIFFYPMLIHVYDTCTCMCISLHAHIHVHVYEHTCTCTGV